MQRTISFGLFLSLLLLASPASSSQVENDEWRDTFKFQLKMAEYGSAKAQYSLAEMYAEGRGTPRNYAKAIEWYNKAEKNGHPHPASKVARLRAKIANAKARLKKK